MGQLQYNIYFEKVKTHVHFFYEQDAEKHTLAPRRPAYFVPRAHKDKSGVIL